jgi:hypothetical protein
MTMRGTAVSTMLVLAFGSLAARAAPNDNPPPRMEPAPTVLWSKLSQCVPAAAWGQCDYIDAHVADFERANDRIELTVIASQRTVARVQRTAKSGPRGFCWEGMLDDGGRAAFAVSDGGGFVGEVTTFGGRRFRVRIDAAARYYLEELDPASFRTVPAHDPEERRQGPDDPKACRTDRDDRLDVLFAYTPKVLAAAGDADHVAGWAQLAVCQANWSFADARLPFTLQTVGVKGIASYAGDADPPQTQRDAMREPAGSLATVASWRDDAGADFAILLVEQNGLGGNAPQMTQADVHHPETFASLAYGVIDRSQLTGSSMLAHEIGHMMGANHDAATSPQPTAFDFSHGHVQAEPSAAFPGGWMTIMSEGTACRSCVRIARFSTADRDALFDGRPLGARSKDNVRTLATTASTAANYRCRRDP